MAANPTDLRVISHNASRARRLPMGATAIKPGQLVKFASNVIVPAADNDENIRIFVALEYGVASTGTILVVPFSDAVVEMAYSGSPTVGTDYGISGPATVDASNTTQLLVTVLAVNTARSTVDVIEYQIAG